MYKKILTLIAIILILITTTSCSYDIKNIFKDEKPANSYHTYNLIDCYVDSTPNEVAVFDINLYKQKNLKEEEAFDVLRFINSIKNEYFIDKPDNIDTIPVYKLFITFENEKYIINVYNERYISIYPWDGEYSMDYIDMAEIPLAFNLYGLCRYFLS